MKLPLSVGRNKLSNSRAFTLAELLVVVAVVAAMGIIMTEIFSRSLRGGNKSQVLSSIKQNGQSVLENMGSTIRNSDQVVCPSGNSSAKTLVMVKDNAYTRFRMTDEVAGTANGYISRDNPVPGPTEPIGDFNGGPGTFLGRVCLDNDFMISVVDLTDRNGKSGVSVQTVLPANNPPFTRSKLAGYKDVVIINFNLKPGVAVPSAISGQIDAVTFTTTIELR